MQAFSAFHIAVLMLILSPFNRKCEPKTLPEKVVVDHDQQQNNSKLENVVAANRGDLRRHIIVKRHAAPDPRPRPRPKGGGLPDGETAGVGHLSLNISHDLKVGKTGLAFTIVAFIVLFCLIVFLIFFYWRLRICK